MAWVEKKALTDESQENPSRKSGMNFGKLSNPLLAIRYARLAKWPSMFSVRNLITLYF